MSTNEDLKNKMAVRTSGAGPAKSATFEDMVKERAGKFAEILPQTMPVERFLRVVTGVVNTNKALRECDKLSVLSACVLAAQLGLEPGPLGHAYLVPFKEKGVPKAQFIIGYKGYIDLARRSGTIKAINTGKICENDFYEYEDIGEDMMPRLVHRRKMDGDRGRGIAYYVVTHYEGGGREAVVLTRSEVESYRNRSSSKNSPAWRDDYDAMAIKTCCRRAATFWPLTIEAQQAIAADGVVSSSLTMDLAADAAVSNANFDVIDVDEVQGGSEDQASQQQQPEDQPVVVDNETGEIVSSAVVNLKNALQERKLRGPAGFKLISESTGVDVKSWDDVSEDIAEEALSKLPLHGDDDR